MRISEYTPEQFDRLSSASRLITSRNLGCREFVNHYYASSPWCKLHLLASRDDALIGLLGIEQMPFSHRSKGITVGFGTNYYSMEPGAGGFLFLHWMKRCDLGISFGGSEDAHNVIRSQKWPYFDGVDVYLLNKPYHTYSGQPAWKRAAKWVARHSTRRKIAAYSRNVPAQISKQICVQEEFAYNDDLLPKASPFEFRFAPTAEYLSWRYALRLPFVRYRLFRILTGQRTSGYVILNENPERVLVSQCDGDDPETLAWGVVLSILNVGCTDQYPRTVMLTCCHPVMQEIYRSVGFKKDSTHPFALGSLRAGIAPASGAATSNWLVNFDWGDNGLMDLH